MMSEQKLFAKLAEAKRLLASAQRHAAVASEIVTEAAVALLKSVKKQ